MTTFRIGIFFLLLLLVFPVHDGGVVARTDATATADEDETSKTTTEEEEWWTKCNCPASNPSYNPSLLSSRPPSARMAYLISVHNRRTIDDGAHLLRALMETSHPGDTAIILIHVDKRVGIASREFVAEEEEEKNQFLYHDSKLRKYVDACLATLACTKSSRRDAMNTKNGSNDNNNNKNGTMILEVHSHFAPEWSKWSMNDPTLWAMDYLTNHPKLHRQTDQQQQQSDSGSSTSSSISTSLWDVFINLSGDTLPVVTATRISQLFHPHSGPLGNTNFVTSASCVTGLLPTSIFEFPQHSMKRAHYFQKNIPKTLSYVDATTGKWVEDVKVPIYFGSQWMALTQEFVEYVVRSLDHPNGLGNVLKETLTETGVLMTDETFFATMLMNSPQFEHTIPKLNEDGALERFPTLYSLRYERMDENAPNAWGEYTSSDPLYDIPPRFGRATDGEGPAKAWGPYFLGTYDLGAIKDHGALFVRKVSTTVDENLVRLLPVRRKKGWKEEDGLEWDELPDIRWPELGVKIKDPFVWKYEVEEEEQ